MSAFCIHQYIEKHQNPEQVIKTLVEKMDNKLFPLEKFKKLISKEEQKSLIVVLGNFKCLKSKKETQHLVPPKPVQWILFNHMLLGRSQLVVEDTIVENELKIF